MKKPTIRNHVARSPLMQKGGAHGPSPRAQRRNQRQQLRQEAQAEYWDDWQDEQALTQHNGYNKEKGADWPPSAFRVFNNAPLAFVQTHTIL